MKQLNDIRYITSTLILLVVLGGTYLHMQVVSGSENVLVSCINDAPVVSAQAYYVENITTGEVIYEKHANSQLPLASITKIMTALVANESLKEDKVISIPESALIPEGNSGLFASELWEVGDLTDFMLMTSSNDGARALALLSAGEVEAFVDEMNNTAKSIGLKQTFFLSDTGLDVSTTTAGAYGSARDISHLLKYAHEINDGALDGSAQLAGVYQSISGFLHEAEHTSTLPGTIPGSLIIKTGFTDLAGGNLAVLAELMPGVPVSIVVLGSDLESRDADVLLLANAAKSHLKREAVCKSL